MKINNEVILQKNAIFIADSHFKENDFDMLSAFEMIDSNSQIFFMGDIFHLILGNIKSSLKPNIQLIEIIKNLKNEVIYLEGNHDFYMQNIFKGNKNIKVFKRKDQPLIIRDYKNDTCILSHGDLFLGSGYERYISMYDNVFIIKPLEMLDIISFGTVYRFISNKVYKNAIKNFESSIDKRQEFILKRIALYKKNLISKMDIDGEKIYIYEGHFHLGQKLEISNISYIGLPSFYFDRNIVLHSV